VVSGPLNLPYASRAFAALASAQRVPEFVCDYVGRGLAVEGHDAFVVYLVRRSDALWLDACRARGTINGTSSMKEQTVLPFLGR
jgi:hypothetical protein